VTEARSHRRRGKKTPTLVTQKQNGRETNELQFSVACFSIRRSGLERRETFRSPVMPYGALDSVGRPRCESGESELGTHEVRVHAVRLDGRYRLDALSVFLAGRSQGLLDRQRGR
jgi:hypothetical protein